jgi:putative DNA primase/helicase
MTGPGGHGGAALPDHVPPSPEALIQLLQKLPDNTPVEEIERALRILAKRAAHLDRLAREGLRERSLRELKRLGVHSPSRLFDAALSWTGTEESKAQGSPVELDPPDLWPHTVDGAALLERLDATFRRFLALKEGCAEAMSLWVLHAHALDAFQVSPRLALTSPTKRCGKTTALYLLSALVPKPVFTVNVTSAALFRLVERDHPTLLIDEADAWMEGKGGELRGILNAGHTRRSHVIRTVGEDHEPRRFHTWCPVAIACIGKLPDTLADRSIAIPMSRRTRGEQVERLRLDRLDGELEHLRSQAARWALDHLEALREADPEVPGALHDRERDNWSPLLAIADQAGGPWPKRARQAALALSGASQDDDDNGILLLADIRSVFEGHGQGKLSTESLLEALHAMQERPWGEWYKGQPITARQVARLLQRFGIRPKNVRVPAHPEDGDMAMAGPKGTTVMTVAKGYERADFKDAWQRYLPSPPSGVEIYPLHPLQPHEIGHGASGSIRYNTPSVADEKNGSIPDKIENVADVADRGEGSGGMKGGVNPRAFCMEELGREEPLNTRHDNNLVAMGDLRHTHCVAGWDLLAALEDVS